MPARPVVFRQHSGGISTDPKVGIPYSVANIQAMDFRKSPSQLSVLPGLAKESGAIVTDLIQDFVMVPNGTIYALGDTGNFYKRTTSGVWSLIGTIGVGTFGMDYRRETDNIYLTGTTTVSIYGPVLGTPTLTVGKYASSYSTYNNSIEAGFNVSAYQTGSGFTYTPPTAISENAVSRRYFQLDIEPLVSISVYIQNKGTGSWTVTLHDGLNNVLGTSTIASAALVNNSFNVFTFSPIRMAIYPAAQTYHFHVTSTVADGTLTTTANGDLSGADLQIFANRMLQTTNGIHPMARFLQYEVIGNGNYLSVWEPLSEPPTNEEWVRCRLQFPMGYEVCGLSVFNEFLAIALQKVSTNATSDPQEGLIAFWDGLSTDTSQIHPNYFTKVPEGTPQCIREYKNAIYYYAGGAEYRIDSPTSQPVKIRTMPNSDTEFFGAAVPITVYPNAATVRRGILLLGYPSTTTSTSINYGVYSWGSVDQNFPESFGYNYVLSTGTQNYSVSNGLTIGAVRNFGDTLLVSWKDSGSYGVDTITNASAPAITSKWESLILDNGTAVKEKRALYMEVPLSSFPADASVVLKYKLNRASAWTTSVDEGIPVFTVANTPTKVCRLDIRGKRYYEFQLGADVTSGTTTPIMTTPTFVYDDASNEAWS